MLVHSFFGMLLNWCDIFVTKNAKQLNEDGYVVFMIVTAVECLYSTDHECNPGM